MQLQILDNVLPTPALEYVRVGCANLVGPAMLATMRLEEIPRYVGDGLLYQLEAYVLAERLAPQSKEIEVEWPKSRWQTWKLHHPGRIARRFPVQHLKATVTIDIASWAAFPHSTICSPDLGKPVYWQEVTHSVNP